MRHDQRPPGAAGLRLHPPTNLTVVRFDLDALGLTAKDVLEGTESPESSLHRRLSLGRPRALTRRLEQAWATYGLTGVAFIYPFALSALPSATGFTDFPGKTHQRAEDPLLVLNVLSRARSRLLLSNAPPALESALLGRSLASSDPRLVQLAEATGYRSEANQ